MTLWSLEPQDAALVAHAQCSYALTGPSLEGESNKSVYRAGSLAAWGGGVAGCVHASAFPRGSGECVNGGEDPSAGKGKRGEFNWEWVMFRRKAIVIKQRGWRGATGHVCLSESAVCITRRHLSLALNTVSDQRSLGDAFAVRCRGLDPHPV